jgi:hypothetical protein
VYVFDENNHGLTDGSGFISSDLAKTFPLRIVQGRPAIQVQQHHFSHSSSGPQAPAAYQCRIICSLGIFKGTLVVRDDIENTIALRKSMQKVSSASSESDSLVKSSSSSSSSVSTSAAQLQDTVVELLNSSRVPKYSATELNYQLILILSELGVPEDIFKRKMAEKMKILKEMCESKSAAIRYFRSIEQYRTGYYDEDAILLDTDTDRNRRLIVGMLLSGHEISDPFIQCSLRLLRDRELEESLRLRITVPRSFYLMGIPDPSGVLHKDEVYLGRNVYPGDEVIITRFPLLSSLAVRRFRVLSEGPRRTTLDAFFSGRGGVVVFSSCGDDDCLSPVDPMNGDYDGDL